MQKIFERVAKKHMERMALNLPPLNPEQKEFIRWTRGTGLGILMALSGYYSEDMLSKFMRLGAELGRLFNYTASEAQMRILESIQQAEWYSLGGDDSNLKWKEHVDYLVNLRWEQDAIEYVLKCSLPKHLSGEAEIDLKLLDRDKLLIRVKDIFDQFGFPLSDQALKLLRGVNDIIGFMETDGKKESTFLVRLNRALKSVHPSLNVKGQLSKEVYEVLEEELEVDSDAPRASELKLQDLSGEPSIRSMKVDKFHIAPTSKPSIYHITYDIIIEIADIPDQI